MLDREAERLSRTGTGAPLFAQRSSLAPLGAVCDQEAPHGLRVDASPRVLERVQRRLPTVAERVDVRAIVEQRFCDPDA